MRMGVTLNAMLLHDPTLFDGVTVPTGVNRSVLVDTICFNYGDLYLTNTDPVWTKAAITVWGQRHKYYMDELYKTLNYEYNPIENYDRYEEYTDTTAATSSGTSSEESSGTSSATTSAQTSSSTTQNLAAYNASTMQPDSSSADTGTQSGTNSGTNSSTTSGETSGTRNETLEHEAHIHGNIGVTTAAQMIQGQRDIIKISWYDTIADLFASEFCIMIY